MQRLYLIVFTVTSNKSEYIRIIAERLHVIIESDLARYTSTTTTTPLPGVSTDGLFSRGSTSTPFDLS